MRSIRFRFIAFLSVLLLVLLLLLNTYPLILSRDAVFEEKHSSMSSQAAVFALSLEGLEQLSQSSIVEVLTFLDLTDYDRIVVTDENAEVIYDSAADVSPLDPGDLHTALSGKTVFRSRFREAAFLSSLAMPMSDQGAIEGAVYLQELDTERAEGIWAVQRRLRTLSFAIGSAALLLAAAAIFPITRRLRGLVRSMRVVAEGDYHYRYTVRGHDEISALGEEFNRLTEQLERNETMRRRFVADASHELKTPLASIRLLSDSVLQSENMGKETMREFVADIGEEAIRLQRTTEKLLTLSRLDAEPPAAPEPVDLGQAAQDAIYTLSPLAQEKKVRLIGEAAKGCTILGSRDSVDHILYNLIENAVKYNVPGGTVRLRLYTEGERVLLEVADTGIGIPESDRPLIFDRFYRVDKARSREAGGSGLGLSIVHDAVLAQGGEIRVEQNIPQGSRFIVSFPRIQAEEKTE